ncbi:MAG TPA: TIGR00296 family protein [Candidatus Thermoplasmatota archaeon]
MTAPRASRVPNGYSLGDGEAAVRIARAAVEAAVRGERFALPPLTEIFRRNAGVFTTLNDFPSMQLRGCVGFAEPVETLAVALVEASRAAALEDGRFGPVGPDELARLVVEVSLLTPPREVEVARREAIPGAVEVGRHGLVVRRGRAGGLLLPQVAADWRWDAEEFLEQACRKAGLPRDAWAQEGTRVLVFEADVFAEEAPRGAVARHGAGRASEG